MYVQNGDFCVANLSLGISKVNEPTTTTVTTATAVLIVALLLLLLATRVCPHFRVLPPPPPLYTVQISELYLLKLLAKVVACLFNFPRHENYYYYYKPPSASLAR